jgi:hypothetical protein
MIAKHLLTFSTPKRYLQAILVFIKRDH